MAPTTPSQTPVAEAATPEEQPLVSTVSREGFVIVEVGTERRQFHLHGALLIHHSEYFRGALNGPWKEATDKVIPLKDIEPSTFSIFVNWLYTRLLPTKFSEWTEVNEGSYLPNPLDDDECVTAMVKAYVFGDRSLAKSFQQAVNRHLVSHVIDQRPIPAWFFAAIYAFENLPAHDTMLEFFIDIHCRYWQKADEDDDLVSEQEVRLRPQLSPKFLFPMMDTYSKKVMVADITWWKKRLDACDYRKHSSTEERAECLNRN